VILAAARIRKGADREALVPVVIFCLDGIAEGDEVAIDENVHLTRPDNFNQLRGLLARVLEDANLRPRSKRASSMEEIG
jgi:hypothetical protein